MDVDGPGGTYGIIKLLCGVELDSRYRKKVAGSERLIQSSVYIQGRTGLNWIPVRIRLGIDSMLTMTW